MNAQHVVNIKENRLRRITHKIIELEAAKVHEINIAERNHREPNLDVIMAQMSRLESRRRELQGKA